MKSRHKAGTPIIASKRKLGSATLTVAVLILFLVLVRTALFLLVMAGLTALLALSGLVTFLFHIVCHKNILLKERERAALLKFKRLLQT